MKLATTDEIRRSNLSALAAEHGGVRALADLLGKSESQLSQWINASINSGTGKPRGMRSSTCREIEVALGLPEAWLDTPHPEVDSSAPRFDATRRANLKRLVSQHGLTSVASRMGRPATQVNDMLAGRKAFGEKVARAMESQWDSSAPAGWLDRMDDPAPVFTLLTTPTDEDQIVIPQFDTGGAMGAGLELRDQPGIIKSWKVSPEWLQKNVRGYSAAGNLCIVTGFGDSMRGMFNPGDPLIVDLGVNVVAFDAVYFFRVGNEGFIKRLQRIPGEGLVAISANKAYRDWTIKPDMDLEVFGRVLKVWCSEDF